MRMCVWGGGGLVLLIMMELERRVRREESMVHKAPSPRHLYLCRIRCNFGTDDVFFPFLIAFAIRATWIFVAIGTIVYLVLRPGCLSLSVPVILYASIIGFSLVQLAGIFNDLIIMGISNMGSLAVTKPREKIVFFLYIALFVYFFEFAWDAFSTYTVFSDPVSSLRVNCTSYSNVVVIYRVVIMIDWAILAVIFITFFILLDPLGCFLFSSLIRDIEADLARLRVEPDGESKSGRGVHKNYIDASLWMHRCKRQYCQCLRRDGLSSSERDALGDVVKAFGVLFSDVNFTFTDILSGFRLALVYHRGLAGGDPAEEMKNVTVKLLKEYNVIDRDYSPPRPITLAYDERKRIAKELKYYLNYSMAAYGWPIHVYLNPCCGPLSLCINARCNCCCARCQIQQFDGDTGFPNLAAVKTIAGVDGEDIIDASFVNSVHIVPFYVAVDRREGREDLVIAIRGTFSIKDVLTDVSVSMMRLNDGLLGVKPCFVHRGFYEAAEGIYKHVIDKQQFKQLLMEKKYRLVLTGHSLGAAVASVLAVLFKERHPEHTQRLKAYTFSTPGAVFDYLLARKTEAFILSVIGGHDMVPRMTMRGLTYLKMTILELIGKCPHTKPRVLCCTGCCGWTPPTPQDSNLLNLVPKKAHLSASLHSLDLAIDEKTPGFKLVENSLPFLTKQSTTSSSHGSLQQTQTFTLSTLDRSEASEETDSPQQQHITTHTVPVGLRDFPHKQRVEWDCSTKSEATCDSPQQCCVEWNGDPKVGLTFSIKSRLKKEHHKKKHCTAKFLKQMDDFRAELKGERIETDQVDGPESDDKEQPLMFIPGRILHLQEGQQYANKTCCGCRKARRIVASWKSREHFSAIQVSTSMLLDHGPSRTVDFIQHFWEQAEMPYDVAMETITSQEVDNPESRPRMSTV